jgi:hypothetical protein
MILIIIFDSEIRDSGLKPEEQHTVRCSGEFRSLNASETVAGDANGEGSFCGSDD